MNHADREPEWDFPGCRAFLDPKAWRAVISTCRDDETPDRFLEEIRIQARRIGAPGFLPELARLEWHVRKVHEGELVLPDDPGETILNPSLHLLELRWKNLASFRGLATAQTPDPGAEFVMIWRNPADGELRRHAATAEDLLVLKMVAEGIDRKEVATTGGLPVWAVDAALERAAGKGIILLPASRIRRDPGRTGESPYAVKPFVTASAFTLQWHITQACDLRCRHCYDRTDRTAPTLAQAGKILDDLEDFCRKKRVKGQVSFSGGNPLLHPDFLRIYRAAAEVHACRKFPSPLGNVSRQRLAEIYDSDLARRYRSGCAECRSCRLAPVCGGCLACAYSHGLDIFAQKDPYCFLSECSSHSRRAGLT